MFVSMTPMNYSSRRRCRNVLVRTAATMIGCWPVVCSIASDERYRNLSIEGPISVKRASLGTGLTIHLYHEIWAVLINGMGAKAQFSEGKSSSSLLSDIPKIQQFDFIFPPSLSNIIAFTQGRKTLYRLSTVRTKVVVFQDLKDMCSS
jgi:hypothetical protein